VSSLIDPNAVNVGEQVVIQDENKNTIEGPADFDEKGRMIIRAFRGEIVFARWSKSARGGLGGYTTVKGIKIVGHQAPLDAFAFDTVPQQRFGSNPT
jgi:hypothetical protein